MENIEELKEFTERDRLDAEELEKQRINSRETDKKNFRIGLISIVVVTLLIFGIGIINNIYKQKQEQKQQEYTIRIEEERRQNEEHDSIAREEESRKIEERDRIVREKEQKRLQAERDSFAQMLNIEVVLVDGGTFMMGCTAEQGRDCNDRERPARQVTVSSFYICKYEVTQAQWVGVMGYNPSKSQGDNLPVENVSWNDVQEFLRIVNEKTGKEYRLPTETEWEFAARGGNQSKGYKYSGSNNVNEVAWHKGNSGGKTRPVGTKKPNELGLYDMSGNVWEWCSDWYATYPSSAQTNPQGLSSGENRVDRSGSWFYGPEWCRVSARSQYKPDGFGHSLGFRLAHSEANVESSSSTKTEQQNLDPNRPKKGDVFVAGYTEDGQIDNSGYPNKKAKLWKNGIEQNLSDGTTNEYAYSVFVSGNDVYVAGSKLWKNGIVQKLPNGTDHPGGVSVFVSGSDVYVASGWGCILWKNGIEQKFSFGSWDQTTSVFVSGNDLYVAGHVYINRVDEPSMAVAKLWKNGIAQNLSDGIRSAGASSVFVSGSDVYVVGKEFSGNEYQFFNSTLRYSVAKLWKNGVGQNLTNGTRLANANSIFVSGNDVYITGNERQGSTDIDKLWKNGVPQITNDRGGMADGGSVFVSGSNVYVVVYNKFLKNGVNQNIGNGIFKSVFVVE